MQRCFVHLLDFVEVKSWIHKFHVKTKVFAVQLHVRVVRVCVAWSLGTEENNHVQRGISQNQVLKCSVCVLRSATLQGKNKKIKLKWPSYGPVTTIGYLRSGRKSAACCKYWCLLGHVDGRVRIWCNSLNPCLGANNEGCKGVVFLSTNYPRNLNSVCWPCRADTSRPRSTLTRGGNHQVIKIGLSTVESYGMCEFVTTKIEEWNCFILRTKLKWTLTYTKSLLTI